MHELAITRSLVDAVTEQLPGARILAVHLDIGKLSGVVPDAVRFCFELVATGTALEGAVLDIAEPVGELRCFDCGRRTELNDPIPLCPCGSADVTVLSGQELRIRAVEVS